MCTQVERRLDCDLQSVREARRIVADVLQEAGLSHRRVGRDVIDDAVLMASELLANAVRACREILVVRVEVHRTWLKIGVSDDSPAPAVRRRPGPEETHGRGVDILARLSDEWGQSRWDGFTKTVWGRLDLAPEEALSITCHER